MNDNTTDETPLAVRMMELSVMASREEELPPDDTPRGRSLRDFHQSNWQS